VAFEDDKAEVVPKKASVTDLTVQRICRVQPVISTGMLFVIESYYQILNCLAMVMFNKPELHCCVFVPD
jgi:hypothetical protein